MQGVARMRPCVNSREITCKFGSACCATLRAAPPFCLPHRATVQRQRPKLGAGAAPAGQGAGRARDRPAAHLARCPLSSPVLPRPARWRGAWGGEPQRWRGSPAAPSWLSVLSSNARIAHIANGNDKPSQRGLHPWRSPLVGMAAVQMSLLSLSSCFRAV